MSSIRNAAPMCFGWFLEYTCIRTCTPSAHYLQNQLYTTYIQE